mmetsp:Transcript_25833/g.41059  ORF Transcript_25833/g.41059 Transcript_25833/m.41059 type:complete len:84 (+) Transcript_25833:1591-1842(+)
MFRIPYSIYSIFCGLDHVQHAHCVQSVAPVVCVMIAGFLHALGQARQLGMFSCTVLFFVAWRFPAGFHSVSTLFHSRDGSDKA